MKLMKINLLALAIVLGSSLSFTTSAFAAEDSDDSEETCIQGLKDKINEHTDALIDCVVDAVNENEGDEAEEEACKESCDDELELATEISMEEFTACIENED